MNLKHLAALHRNERIDSITICHLDSALTAMLGAKRGRVRLSHDTMRKQRRKHDELLIEEYEIIEAALRLGEYRRDDDATMVVLFVDTVRFNVNRRGKLTP
jgi:hypothetical protein